MHDQADFHLDRWRYRTPYQTVWNAGKHPLGNDACSIPIGHHINLSSCRFHKQSVAQVYFIVVQLLHNGVIRDPAENHIFIAVLQIDVLNFITMNGDHAKFTNRRFSAIIFVSYMITALLVGWLEKTVIMAEMRRKRRK